MPFAPDPETADLLVAHDELLRGEPELVGADDVRPLAELWLARFGESGFVTHPALRQRSDIELDELITAVVAAFGAEGIEQFEWKTRSHDAGNDRLTAALLRAGLQPDPVETVMIGRTAALVVPVELPQPLVLRQAGADGADLGEDVAAVDALHTAVFGRHGASFSTGLLRELRTHPERLELWLVSEGASAVSAGRVEFGGAVAGLFGGATLPQWRGRGLYRALTAARARSAARSGCELVYAECTPFSQPILRSAGLRAVTTTTPYLWRRAC